MEVSDMLDIIHVMYERDNTPLYEEHLKIKSDLRVSIWRHIYHSEYKHPHQDAASSPASYGSPLPPDESLLPDENAEKPLKPFVAATDPEKLMEILDEPMGGMPL